MAKIRMFFALLLMIALPAQGFAAVLMSSCGMQTSANVAQPNARAQGGVHDSAGGYDSEHDHKVQARRILQEDAKVSKSSLDTAKPAQDQQGQGCPTCALCHVIAASGLGVFNQSPLLPSAEPVAPLLRVQTRTALVPDKPPRT